MAYGHLGDSNLHYNLEPAGGDGGTLASQADGIRRAVRPRRRAWRQHQRRARGIRQLKVDELERYEDPWPRRLMRFIKRALDPLGIMNPRQGPARSVLVRPTPDPQEHVERDEQREGDPDRRPFEGGKRRHDGGHRRDGNERNPVRRRAG